MSLTMQLPTQFLPGGYSFRGARPYDAPDVARLLNIRQPGSDFCTADVREKWLTPAFDLSMDIRMVFNPRDVLVGYIEVWVTDSHPWLWGCVHPEYEGRGIGSALLRWGEARVALALDRLPKMRRIATRFRTFPLQRAHELCENFGWRLVAPSEQLRQEAKKVTGALRLPEISYDVYEKDVQRLN